MVQLHCPVIRTNLDGFGDAVQSREDSEGIGVLLGAEGTQLSDGRGDGTQRVDCPREAVSYTPLTLTTIYAA